MIIDNFDSIRLPSLQYCTYCWQIHYQAGYHCGPDKWRYFSNIADYRAYIRQYQANGYKHSPLGQKQMDQMRMEI